LLRIDKKIVSNVSKYKDFGGIPVEDAESAEVSEESEAYDDKPLESSF
jgi:hypothetical protein